MLTNGTDSCHEVIYFVDKKKRLHYATPSLFESNSYHNQIIFVISIANLCHYLHWYPALEHHSSVQQNIMDTIFTILYWQCDFDSCCVLVNVSLVFCFFVLFQFPFSSSNFASIRKWLRTCTRNWGVVSPFGSELSCCQLTQHLIWRGCHSKDRIQ